METTYDVPFTCIVTFTYPAASWTTYAAEASRYYIYGARYSTLELHKLISTVFWVLLSNRFISRNVCATKDLNQVNVNDLHSSCSLGKLSFRKIIRPCLESNQNYILWFLTKLNFFFNPLSLLLSAAYRCGSNVNCVRDRIVQGRGNLFILIYSSFYRLGK